MLSSSWLWLSLCASLCMTYLIVCILRYNNSLWAWLWWLCGIITENFVYCMFNLAMIMCYTEKYNFEIFNTILTQPSLVPRLFVGETSFVNAPGLRLHATCVWHVASKKYALSKQSKFSMNNWYFTRLYQEAPNLVHRRPRNKARSFHLAVPLVELLISCPARYKHDITFTPRLPHGHWCSHINKQYGVDVGKTVWVTYFLCYC